MIFFLKREHRVSSRKEMKEHMGIQKTKSLQKRGAPQEGTPTPCEFFMGFKW